MRAGALVCPVAVAWLAPLAVTLIVGCRENVPQRAAASAVAGRIVQNPRSPADTVRQVNALRRQGRAGDVIRWIVPEQRTAVLELMLSLDQLAGANRALQARIIEAIGPGTASRYDYRRVANIIGVLSHDVTVIDEHPDGPNAVVTIQIADRVPLERVQLERGPDHWLIRTDAPVPGVAKELRKLAEALRRIGRQIASGTVTRDRIADTLLRHQAPIFDRLQSLLSAGAVEAES